jgi:hypothetical protein
VDETILRSQRVEGVATVGRDNVEKTRGRVEGVAIVGRDDVKKTKGTKVRHEVTKTISSR